MTHHCELEASLTTIYLQSSEEAPFIIALHYHYHSQFHFLITASWKALLVLFDTAASHEDERRKGRSKSFIGSQKERKKSCLGPAEKPVKASYFYPFSIKPRLSYIP